MLKDLTKKNASPVPLTPEGERYADLAWAPTADVNVIAMRDDPERRLARTSAWPTSSSDETDITCKEEPSFAVIRALHWAKDGRSILGARRQGAGRVRDRALAREEATSRRSRPTSPTGATASS